MTCAPEHYRRSAARTDELPLNDLPTCFNLNKSSTRQRNACASWSATDVAGRILVGLTAHDRLSRDAGQIGKLLLRQR